MKSQQRVVQWAVMCLQELDAQAGKTLSFSEISQRRGIPLAECATVIQRLGDAGIVTLVPTDQVVLRRSVEELTALDILQAVWSRVEQQPVFQMRIGGKDASIVTTAFISRMGADLALNG